MKNEMQVCVLTSFCKNVVSLYLLLTMLNKWGVCSFFLALFCFLLACVALAAQWRSADCPAEPVLDGKRKTYAVQMFPLLFLSVGRRCAEEIPRLTAFTAGFAEHIVVSPGHLLLWYAEAENSPTNCLPCNALFLLLLPLPLLPLLLLLHCHL